ncbi:MAG: Hpt domain-containing protein [Gammaproteobacteria bacterium]|nr:Hpt domain-containing protein [Gammaproteobacteria bacterium]
MSQASISNFFSEFKKYRIIILSVFAFLVIDIVVMVINVQHAKERSQLAQSVSLGGRQGMLTEHMKQILQQMQVALASGGDPNVGLDGLKLTHDVFEGSLMAFKKGGQTMGSDLKPVYVPKIENPKGQALLGQMEQMWQPLKHDIEAILAADVPTLELVDPALAKVRELSPAFGGMGAGLGNMLTQRTEMKTMQMRNTQMIGLVLAALNFLFINIYVIRNLRKADREVRDYADRVQDYANEVVNAKKEADQILETVGDGLFVISAEGEIGAQHSASLNKILMTDRIAGRNFKRMIRPYLDDKTFGMLEDYIALMFKASLKEKMVKSHNPLDCVEFHFETPNKDFVTKYLAFSFSRIVEHGEIKGLLVSVSDATSKVQLEKQLIASQEKTRKQMDMLFGLIHVGPQMLKEFIDSAQIHIVTINGLLKKAEQSRDYKATVEPIFREMHTLKGNASVLELALYVEMAHRFEDELSRLREKDVVAGEDFIGVTLRLDELGQSLNDSIELLEQLSRLQDAFGNTTSKPSDKIFVESIARMANKFAEEVGVKARIAFEGAQFDSIKPQHYQTVSDVLTQLVRNAIAHGIEKPTERLSRNKPEIGTVHVYTELGEHGIEFRVRDDGRGLDLEKIRNRARELGKHPQNEIERMSSAELASLIFTSGFTTSGEATEAAGRGVGMGIVRERVRALGGRMQMRFVKGKGCEFKISLPH